MFYTMHTVITFVSRGNHKVSKKEKRGKAGGCIFKQIKEQTVSSTLQSRCCLMHFGGFLFSSGVKGKCRIIHL